MKTLEVQSGCSESSAEICRLTRYGEDLTGSQVYMYAPARWFRLECYLDGITTMQRIADPVSNNIQRVFSQLFEFEMGQGCSEIFLYVDHFIELAIRGFKIQ